MAAPDVFLQVVGREGEVVARSGNLGDRVLPLPAAARRGDVVEVRADGRPLFLTAAPLDGGRHVIVARSPVTTYAALRTLRQLLTAVVAGAVDLLARGAGVDDEFRDRALADVAAETDRMARMVRQLLILARADAGAVIEPRPVRLDEVVAAACRQVPGAADGVTLLCPEPHALAGAVVDGDADHLTQLLLILLDNAVKYTPAPGEVHVAATRDDGFARIVVADTGPGVPDQDRDRIFERFYRGRNAGMATGTGLGLSIARWIVDQHGGAIELTSSANGSRFTVQLPLARSPQIA